MEVKMIILGIILIVLLYLLYVIFLKKKMTLETSRQIDGTVYKYKTFNSPSSANYYIICWVFIERFGNQTEEQLLYEIKNSDTFILKVLLNNDGHLVYRINDDDDIESIVHDDFPLQKWTCFVISVDGNKVIDSYIDGKLVKSQKRDVLVNNSSTESILIEGKLEFEDGQPNGNDIRFDVLERIPQVMDPATAWNEFITKNIGTSSSISDYGLSLRFLKNDDVKTSISFPRGGIEFN